MLGLALLVGSKPVGLLGVRVRCFRQKNLLGWLVSKASTLPVRTYLVSLVVALVQILVLPLVRRRVAPTVVSIVHLVRTDHRVSLCPGRRRLVMLLLQ